MTLKESIDTAAKTGTSSGNRDKLLIGYTPYYTAGIWCGYRDGSTGIYSVSPNHIEIWDSVMKEIHQNTINAGEETEAFDVSGLTIGHYCKESGCAATEGCYALGEVCIGYYKEGEVLSERCPLHDAVE